MQLDLLAINQAFFKFWPELYHGPYFINKGYCFKWAYCAYCLYGGQLYSTQVHAWIQIDNLHYDAECLTGMKSARDLRVNSEWIISNEELQQLTEEEFCREWDFNPQELIPVLAKAKEIIRRRNG